MDNGQTEVCNTYISIGQNGLCRGTYSQLGSKGGKC